MSDFKKSLQEEYDELEVRTEKLFTFIMSKDDYAKLKPIDMNLLSAQHSLMTAYKTILRQRIANLSNP